ncbi:putative bifunctional diguanylate cyclase/phosphodiesterase [Planococcus sp. FY231025]|uniref:putative bifunctional diguanylate cyclase/phosphodiesterase n=1 Tax=Planococcus sp. FY231025 TaxID=3455699 RepID=UPI003F90CEA4
MLILQGGNPTLPANLVSALAPLVAAAVLFAVYRKISGKEKMFWLLIALGCLSYVIAEGLWIYSENVLGEEIPYPGWADLFYFFQIAFYLAALLYHGWHGRRDLQLLRLAFDVTIIMAVFSALSWHFIIKDLIGGTASPLTLAVSAGYPIGSLLLLFGLASFYISKVPLFSRSVLHLIAASLLLQIVADSIYLYETATGIYSSGSFYDPLWSLSLLLMALAGLFALDEQLAPAPPLAPAKPDTSVGLLPYLSMALLFVVMIFEQKNDMNGLIAGAGVSVLLIFARQIMALTENHRLLEQYHGLNEVLEQKIGQRTRELSSKNEQLTEAMHQMQHMAYHDVLSGLPNRRLFLDKLTAAMAEARLYSHKVAVVFVDLDRFKNINDTYGHEFGDLLLKGFSRKMAENLRKDDTVSRQGGDEFALILNKISEEEDIVPLIKRIQSVLEQPVTVNGQELDISMSIGVAIYPGDGATTEELMKHADIAMYHAKEHGRNNYQFFSEDMNATLTRKVQLENGLRNALANEEFLLHYQPQVHGATGKVTGMETLIRWRTADGTLVSPAEFIPLAEETRLILPIGEWVLVNACRQAKNWHDEGHRHLKLAVNLSPLQFLDASLMEIVRGALEKTGFPASSLELEITEGVAVYDAEMAIARMEALRKLGIGIAIDDFGTGYSSMMYLKRFPVTNLKIAQPFVQDMETSPADKALVATMVSMAHSMGMSVIAEGVETLEQLESLRVLGCDEIQGYLFSRPLPAEQFTSMLKSGLPHPSRA